MTGDTRADRPPLTRRRLSKDERDTLDEKIGARVREAGFDPVRPRDGGAAPLPKNRWIFPSVAYSRGGKYAAQFKAAFNDVATANFRLVTLRFGDAKPAHGELEAHIKKVSEAANNVVRYLVRQKIAQPQLSAIHIRYDDVSGRLDPHLHGVWEISPELTSRVEDLLRKHFSGVWIDMEPVRKPSSVAFYVCTGVVDHPAVAHWPLAAIDEIWLLPGRLHFIRPAGAFAEWIRTHRATVAVRNAPIGSADATRSGFAAPSVSEHVSGHSSSLAGVSGAPPTANSKSASAPSSTSSASSAAQEDHRQGAEAAATRTVLPAQTTAAGFNKILALLMQLAATQKPD
ncbi:hypothetical protein [Rhodoblastus sp.]|uniref:hypothetical protein n=1 Tax=Rhodoblastus sp. TaxID=1962975 RepID=UPI003F980EFD